MEKDMNAKNTQMIFISGFPSFQIHYFPKRLIFDKEELILDTEELILDMEEEILSPKIKRFSFKKSRKNL